MSHPLPFGVLQAEARAKASSSPLEAPIPADVVMMLAGYFAKPGRKAEAIYRLNGKVYADVVSGLGGPEPTQVSTYRMRGWGSDGDIMVEEVFWYQSDQPRTAAEQELLIEDFEARAKAHHAQRSALEEEAEALFRRATISLVWDGDEA